MASGPYSFIDIAVLDEVRQRFAAGDALAILTVDLDEAIWANGPGAALLGYSDIESVMGGPAGLGFAARRQIAATPGFPRVGRDRPVAVRLASGMTSRAVTLLVSGIALPDGEPAVLIAVPARTPGSLTSDEMARRAIDGFGEAGYFAALVDADARLLAASDGFDRLRIAPATLVRLIDEVAGQDDRLIKRLIPAGDARIPAGFARLTDEPALHLLIAVDEPAEPRAAVTEAEPAAPSDADLPERVEEDGALGHPPAADEASTTETAPQAGETEVPATEAREAGRAEDGDVRKEAAHADAAAAPEAAAVPLPRHAIPTGPVRFVWRTDAAGAFSAISPEFAEAVGAQAAAVIGRRFAEVAKEFGLDPQGEIAGLLERRDTWSGRSVLWPVEGTDLVAPVDLAALPVYSRDRTFEGFRGFGVARMADAAADPAARGLRLGLPQPVREEAPSEPAQSAEPEPEERTEPKAEEAAPPADHEPLKKHGDPFQGEVPVISIAERRERRRSDKVIRLAEHRTPPTPPDRQLSATERNAFEEIRARLRKDYEADERGDKAAQTSAADDGPSQDAARNATADEVQPSDTEATEAPIEVGEEHYDAPHLAALDANAEPDLPADTDKDGDVSEPSQAGGPEDVQAAEEEPAGDIDERADEDEVAEQPEAEASPPVGDAAPDHPPVEEAPLPTPSPALATSGFTPSAFSTDETRASVDAELIAGLPIPLLVHAGDDLYHANREFLALTGYASLDQIRKEGGLDRLFVDRDPQEAPGPAGRKLHLRTLGGDTFPVDAHLQSIRWRAGSALLLSVRRIETEPAPAPAAVGPAPHGLAEAEELQARVAEMRTIIDTATDGVVLIALDGTIRNISRPAEALFGFDSEEVEGKPFASLFAIESQRAARDYLNGLAENGVASVLNDGREVIGREAEGRFIPLFMTIGRLPGDSGYCAVVRDITQWKRAEEDLTQARSQAERASSQKTEFLARVSHEIRTPLNAIIGFSELMIDEKFGPIGSDRYRDYLRDINRSGNHVLDLVNDLLDISKIEAGEQEMNYEAVSLNEALAESVALMQPQANRDRVIIRSSLASRLPEVVADLRSVRQIALNLLSNAIRYTQAGGQVIVSTAYEPSGDVVMRVRDTGVGMSISEIDQALKPFKQINALKRGRHDGTGLGLPLTKAMVEANRASFSIASTPGQGTLVEITFPSTRVLAD